MKTIFLVIFSLTINQLMSQTEIEITSAMNFCQTSPWEMVFNDEFNGNSLNEDKWYTWYPKWPDKSDQWEFGRTHGDAEGQIYRDQNAIVDNGILKLRAEEEAGTWFDASRDYTSGMIHSKSKFRFGKIEIRWTGSCSRFSSSNRPSPSARRLSSNSNSNV